MPCFYQKKKKNTNCHVNKWFTKKRRSPKLHMKCYHNSGPDIPYTNTKRVWIFVWKKRTLIYRFSSPIETLKLSKQLKLLANFCLLVLRLQQGNLCYVLRIFLFRKWSVFLLLSFLFFRNSAISLFVRKKESKILITIIIAVIITTIKFCTKAYLLRCLQIAVSEI